jgi:hypothetical protein
MKTIQKIVCGGVILAVAAASVPKAQAGDREWATAGKVLTGVAVAGALHNIFAPRTEVVYTSYPQPVVVQQPVVYQQVPAQPVVAQQVVAQPAPVQVTQSGPTQTIVVPAQPTVVYQPVVYQPAPVVVYAAPAPVYVGRTYYHGGFHRPFCR